MAMRSRLLSAIGPALRSRATAIQHRLAPEAGFAVPTVTLMLLAAMVMAGVAVTTSIGGQSGAVRDQNVKTALAAAEAGVEQALLQYNRYGLVEDAAPCAPVGGTAPEADGWCPEVSTAVNGAPVAYRVKTTSTEMKGGDIAWTEMEVVSVGTLAGVTRRIDVTASSSAGQGMFVDATVKSKDGINVASNAAIHAGTATNGDINLEGLQCGAATVGIGKELHGKGGYFSDTDCGTLGGEPGEDEIDLPAVNQGRAATENDNYRLFTLDQISGNKNSACFNGFNGAGKADKTCGPRELVIGHNSSVTLGGNVYSFCKLKMDQNSSLYIAPGQEVKIYFDSPEACGYSSGVTQLELQSNTRITPTAGNSGSAALFFVGSPNLSTNILLNSNTSVEEDVVCQQNFVIYAPYTDINLDSNTWFCGGMAGKTVTLDSNAQIWTSSGVQEFFLPLTAPHYEATRFVDCSATTVVGAPNEGC
jgi:hypothetical protein